ncbi:hypothetical protein [Kingella kingae]|uniref:hypothetical protein n=1 Tax=Kingella kingae TaxID=504 RepID=UPI00040DC740|nr:hypothetical protein [Kingella kingae]
MKRTMILGLSLSGLLMPLTAQACSQLQPTAAFAFINDANKDGFLDLYEWQNARSDNLQTSFQVGNLAEFARLDYNQDQKLQAAELGFDSVRYIRAPCADWEEQIRRESRFKSRVQ